MNKIFNNLTIAAKSLLVMTLFVSTLNTLALKTTYENYSKCSHWNKCFKKWSQHFGILISRGLNSLQNIFLGVGNSVFGSGLCASTYILRNARNLVRRAIADLKAYNILRNTEKAGRTWEKHPSKRSLTKEFCSWYDKLIVLMRNMLTFERSLL